MINPMIQSPQKKRTPLRTAKNGKNIFIVAVFMALFLISMISAVSIGTFEKIQILNFIKPVTTVPIVILQQLNIQTLQIF